MRKLLLGVLAVLLLAGCSFEVKETDSDQEDGFSIDLKEKEDDGEE